MAGIARRLERLEAAASPSGDVRGERPPWRSVEAHEERERRFEELYEELDRLAVEAGLQPLEREEESHGDPIGELIDLIEESKKGDE